MTRFIARADRPRYGRLMMAAALFLIAGCVLRPPPNLASPQAPAQAPGALAPGAGPQPAAAEPIRLALLLPLSGEAAPVGQAMLNAAEMAVFDTGVAGLQLMPQDSGGTPESAAAAARASMGQGAQLILGPLFASAVPAVAAVARGAGVNVITFSSDSTVAGGNVLVMGFVPEEQVERIVRFALAHGRNRIGVFAPDTAYGHIVADTAQRTASQAGRRLTAVAYYPADGADDTGYAQQMASRAAASQAVLIPDSGPALRAAARALRGAGLQSQQWLGTGLWDADIAAEPALAGGWYAAPDPDHRRDFEARYAARFGAPPPVVASLAYDAVALAAALSQQPVADPFGLASLTANSGFSGVNGLFRFLPNGVSERALAILEVQPGHIATIDPARQSFGRPF